ncbi:MAG: hypothetical protein ACI4KR_06620, partial [Ruminiclostridium sp.]
SEGNLFFSVVLSQPASYPDFGYLTFLLPPNVFRFLYPNYTRLMCGFYVGIMWADILMLPSRFIGSSACSSQTTRRQKISFLILFLFYREDLWFLCG